MKSKFFVAAATLALCVGATASASAEDLTAAKRAQIKTLLEITNLKAIPEQLANSTIQSWVPGVKQLDPKFPDKGFTIARDAFAATLVAKADAAGCECHLLIPGHSKSDKYTTANEFLFDKLLAP